MSDDFEIGDASRRAADVVSQERDSHGDAYTNHRQQVKQSRMQAGGW